MFAKLLWYTTEIDIETDGFQPVDSNKNYITLKNQITDTNSDRKISRITSYPDFEKIEIKQGLVKFIKSTFKSSFL